MKKIMILFALLFIAFWTSAQSINLKLEGSELQWKVLKNDSSGYFLIQRSENNKEFYNITRIKNFHSKNYGHESPALVSMRTDLLTFYFTDRHPARGNNYYRIVYIDSSKRVISNVVNINLPRGEKIVVYPTPITDSLIIRNAKIGDAFSIERSSDYLGNHPLKRGKINRKVFKVDVSDLDRGNYRLEITEGNWTKPFDFEKN